MDAHLNNDFSCDSCHEASDDLRFIVLNLYGKEQHEVDILCGFYCGVLLFCILFLFYFRIAYTALWYNLLLLE